MPKRAMSVTAVIVALGGFALAIFIPAASAKKPNDVYTQYCEYTEYSEYGEYCEPYTETTAVNGTTTVITSPGFTIQGSAPSGSGSSSGTTAVVISANGVASISASSLKVGEKFSSNGVAIEVLATTANGVEVSFGGVAVDVPSTAAIAISKDGTVTVTYFIAGGKLIPALRTSRSSSFHPVAAVGQQDIILPSKKSSNSFAYVLSKGASFGSKSTWKQVAANFTVEATGKHSLMGKLSKVAVTASTNKARTAATLTMAKPETAFVVKFNVGKLQYSAAEKTYITAHKVKTLSPKFAVTAKLGKTSTKESFGFTYPVA